MSRKPSHKPRPKPGDHLLTITKESAATSQLETAIQLWFNEGDPISIHALATAAHDCLHWMGKNAGKPSILQTVLESESKATQERARYIQNFIKHGWKDLKGKAYYSPGHGEVLMFDAVMCYENVFHKKTPLMGLFFVRYLFEHPDAVLPQGRDLLLEGGKIYNLINRSRREFFDENFPLLLKGDSW